MKKALRFVILITTILCFVSCSQNQNSDGLVFQCPMGCEGDKTYTHQEICPVCKMDLQQKEPKIAYEENEAISSSSIFNLTSQWQTQDNKTITLSDLKGQVFVAVMIYTTCQAACPRLVADVRNIEASIPENLKKDIKYVFISIDPETDTPAQLKSFAKENQMDDKQHIFLHGSEENIREFANVLAVKYKEISPVDFSHSNIISVFNAAGELGFQQEGLGADNNKIVAAIINSINK